MENKVETSSVLSNGNEWWLWELEHSPPCCAERLVISVSSAVNLCLALPCLALFWPSYPITFIRFICAVSFCILGSLSSVPVCERVAVVVFRTFCYFKYRNRLESFEKGINSSYATRDMYRWVKKRVLMQSESAAWKTKSFCSLPLWKWLLLFGSKEILNGQKEVCLNGL